MRQALFSLISVAVLSLVGCSSSSGETTETTADGGELTISSACAAETRKDIYTAGLTMPAADYSVEMTDSEFLPSGSAPQAGQVQKGMNTVTVMVLDANKAPVDGATVGLTPWMPDHQHGSAVTPTVAAEGGGKYTVTNVWLPMAGLWRFTFSVTPANSGATSTKTADFYFCIDG